jgi:hypothetical protein
VNRVTVAIEDQNSGRWKTPVRIGSPRLLASDGRHIYSSLV